MPEQIYGTQRRIVGRRIGGDHWLGYESYKRRPSNIELWTLACAEFLRPLRDPHPLALDFGGASGFRAMRLARKGYDVIVIDFINEQKTIERRNKILSREDRANGKIYLFDFDVRKISTPVLGGLCGGRAPSIISAYNLIHFLEPPEVSSLFKAVAPLATRGSVFGVSYNLPKRFSRLIAHKPNEVAMSAKICGYKLYYQRFLGPYVTQGYRLDFANAPYYR